MPTTDWITQAVTLWLSHGSGMLVPMAQLWTRTLSVSITLWFGGMMLYEAAFGMPMESAHRFFRYWAPSLVLVNVVLTCWNSPLPWTGVSFHQLIPETGRYIVNVLNGSTMAQATHAMDGVLNRVVPPTEWYDFLGDLYYAAATILVWLGEAWMFAIGTFSLVALAVGATVGPIHWALSIWGPFKHMRLDWVNYMISYSMYSVVAAVVLNIWANAIVYGIPTIFGSSGVIESLVLIKAFLLINGGLAYSCKHIDRLTSALFGHAASGAHGYASYLWSYAK